MNQDSGGGGGGPKPPIENQSRVHSLWRPVMISHRGFITSVVSYDTVTDYGTLLKANQQILRVLDMLVRKRFTCYVFVSCHCDIQTF